VAFFDRRCASRKNVERSVAQNRMECVLACPRSDGFGQGHTPGRLTGASRKLANWSKFFSITQTKIGQMSVKTLYLDGFKIERRLPIRDGESRFRPLSAQ
jgi:hypothetical protein